jgi:D-arabinose 1-dehydrogenase-like Zn-dependent alcohol dehydrogenase
MKALRIEEPGRAGLTSVREPEPGAGDVLLRVETVGFCGSDLTTLRGLNPLVSYPRIPGHEIAATVEWVGGEVPTERVRLGERVTVVPYTACGRCSACRRKRVNTCQGNQTLGVQRDGAMTEFVGVPWQKVFMLFFRKTFAARRPASDGVAALARSGARASPGAPARSGA